MRVHIVEEDAFLEEMLANVGKKDLTTCPPSVLLNSCLQFARIIEARHQVRLFSGDGRQEVGREAIRFHDDNARLGANSGPRIRAANSSFRGQADDANRQAQTVPNPKRHTSHDRIVLLPRFRAVLVRSRRRIG